MFNAPYPFKYVMTRPVDPPQPHINTRLYSFIMTNLVAAQKVIYTVIHIMLRIFNELYHQHPSFAFMGSNTKYPDERADEQKANTKRFSSYKKIVSVFFGPETFEYIKDENASILILKNRSSMIDIEMNQILEYI